MRVRRDESGCIVRKARHCRPDELRQRDDCIGVDRRQARHFEQAVAPRDRSRSEVELDTTNLEELSEGVARFGAEEAERPFFGSHEENIHAPSPVISEVLGRQERELVQGQRPGDRRRHGEDDTAELAFGRPVQECGQRRPILRSAKGQRTGDSLARTCAQGKHEGVEVECLAVLEQRNVFVRVDLRDRASAKLSAGCGNQLGKREPAHLTDAEGLRHGQGSVRELLLGCDELDRHPVVRQRAQCQRGLESRDSCAGYYDSKRHDPSHRAWPIAAIVALEWRAAIGAITDSCPNGCGKAAAALVVSADAHGLLQEQIQIERRLR